MLRSFCLGIKLALRATLNRRCQCLGGRNRNAMARSPAQNRSGDGIQFWRIAAFHVLLHGTSHAGR